MGSLLRSQERYGKIINPSLAEGKITFIKEGRELIDRVLDEIIQLDFKNYREEYSSHKITQKEVAKIISEVYNQIEIGRAHV